MNTSAVKKNEYPVQNQICNPEQSEGSPSASRPQCPIGNFRDPAELIRTRISPRRRNPPL